MSIITGFIPSNKSTHGSIKYYICDTEGELPTGVEGEISYTRDNGKLWKFTTVWAEIGSSTSTTPSGSVMMYAGTTAPTGWLICDGSVLNVATYPTLGALLGSVYGGNGVTTFAIPDLRGRVPIGTGAGGGLTVRNLGETGGLEEVALSSDQLPSHFHTIPDHEHNFIPDSHIHAVTLTGYDAEIDHTHDVGSTDKVSGPGTPSGSDGQVSANVDSVAQGGTIESTSIGNTGSTGGNEAHDNMQPFLSLNFIIKI